MNEPQHQPIIDPTPDHPDWPTHAAEPADTTSLRALAHADPTSMTGPALLDAIVASEKALSLLTGMQLRLLTAFAEPFKAGDPMRLAARLARKNCLTGDDDPDQVAMYVPEAAQSLAAAEVAAALRIAPVTAGHRIREATTMTGTLTPTLHAMEHGVLDRGKARVIAEHCAPLSPEHTSTVQQLVLPAAGHLTTSELRDITGHAVITVDPDGAQDRHHAAAARRELALQALPDAMATLKAYLPADGAVKIFQVSDLLATGTAGTPDDPRGIGARRVDALVDIADQLLTHGYLDIADYLGKELPDHTTPPTRTRLRGTDTDTDNTDTTDNTSDAATTDVDQTPDPAVNAATDAVDQAPDVPVHATEPADGRVGGSTPEAPVTDTPSSVDDTQDDQVDDAQADDAQIDDTQIDDTQIDDTEVGEAAVPGATPSTRTARKPGTPDTARSVFTRQGRRPHLSVTLGLDTLAGLNDLPGTLAGFGAIPAGLARSIAASAGTITALLTNPDTGTITAAGTLTYRPRQDLRDQIAALQNTCRFPSCRQPAWRCDIDHREPFDHQHPDQGGPTTLANNDPYCRRHHLFKHHTQWQVRPDPDRTVLHFTSPTGHHYTKHGTQATPPTLWITTTGTTTAEHLDTITNPASTEINPAPTPTSSVEELLTAILIRNAITTTPLEYQPDDTAWNPPTTPPPNNQHEDTGNPDTDPRDDPPPF